MFRIKSASGEDRICELAVRSRCPVGYTDQQPPTTNQNEGYFLSGTTISYMTEALPSKLTGLAEEDF
jgi:hypothetical protein